MTERDGTGHDSMGQNKIGRNITGQYRTGQDRTGQDRTGQDRTGQDQYPNGNSSLFFSLDFQILHLFRLRRHLLLQLPSLLFV